VCYIKCCLVLCLDGLKSMNHHRVCAVIMICVCGYLFDLLSVFVVCVICVSVVNDV